MLNILVYGHSNKFQKLLTCIVKWVDLFIFDQYGIHKLL